MNTEDLKEIAEDFPALGRQLARLERQLLETEGRMLKARGEHVRLVEIVDMWGREVTQVLRRIEALEKARTITAMQAHMDMRRRDVHPLFRDEPGRYEPPREPINTIYGGLLAERRHGAERELIRASKMPVVRVTDLSKTGEDLLAMLPRCEPSVVTPPSADTALPKIDLVCLRQGIRKYLRR